MKRISNIGHGIFIRGNTACFIESKIGKDNRYYEFSDNQISEIDRKIYVKNKFGIENKYWTKPEYEIGILSNNNFVTVFYQENLVRLHLSNGKVINELSSIHPKLKYGGIYGITVDKNDSIWIAAPVENYLGKFDTEGKEIFSIYGTELLEPNELDYPESVVAKNDYVFVSDCGNRRVVKIHIINHQIAEFKRVNEPIYYFGELDEYYIYQLKSGIYLEKKKPAANNG